MIMSLTTQRGVNSSHAVMVVWETVVSQASSSAAISSVLEQDIELQLGMQILLIINKIQNTCLYFLFEFYQHISCVIGM